MKDLPPLRHHHGRRLLAFHMAVHIPKSFVVFFLLCLRSAISLG